VNGRVRHGTDLSHARFLLWTKRSYRSTWIGNVIVVVDESTLKHIIPAITTISGFTSPITAVGIAE